MILWHHSQEGEKWAGLEPGAACREPVSLLEIYPILIQLCGLPANECLEGLFVAPQLKDPGASRKRLAIISYADGSMELYDHRADPDEFTNLANDPKHRSKRDELAAWLPKNAAPEVLEESKFKHLRAQD